jgi:hypothetical protein
MGSWELKRMFVLRGKCGWQRAAKEEAVWSWCHAVDRKGCGDHALRSELPTRTPLSAACALKVQSVRVVGI